MNNLILIIVDCLRYDHVTKELMPFLCDYADSGTLYTNYWATSHCTDPSITHMLSGKHPDALQLYSMMFEHRNYSIPEDVEMLPQLALKHGFDTGFVTNIGRWFKRGVKHFVDCRGWPGEKIFKAGRDLMNKMTEPWFLIVHTDDCHTNYTGGSYKNACRAVDGYISTMLKGTEKDIVFVTADHGEGLGEKGIVQHGHGLWDFLTHVPLITNCQTEHNGVRIKNYNVLLDHGALYSMMKSMITDDYVEDIVRRFVFQAGDTPPNIRHRGIVYPDGSQFIRETRGTEYVARYTVPDDKEHWNEMLKKHAGPDVLLMRHCERHGIDYVDEEMTPEIMKRLEGLGYVGFG